MRQGRVAARRVRGLEACNSSAREHFRAVRFAAAAAELMSREIGRADVEEVRSVAFLGEGRSEPAHACAQTACARIRVRTFETEKDESGSAAGALR